MALDTDPTVSFLNPARITAPPAGSLFIGRLIDVRLPFVNQFHDPSGQPRDTDLNVESPDVMGFDIDLLLGGLCYVEDFGTGPPPNPEDRWRLTAEAGHHQMAICVGASEQESLSAVAEQVSNGSLQADGTVDAEWNRRQLGAGWAWNVTDQLSIGASLFLAISRYQESVYGSSVASTPGLRLSTFSMDSRGMSFDLAAHVGVVYRASDHVTLGAAARLPSFHLLGDWARTVTRAQSPLADDEGTFARTSESGTFITRQPARLSLGVGVHGERFRAELSSYFHAGNDAMIEAQVDRSVSHATDDRDLEQVPARRAEPVDPVANLGIGGEWRALDDVGLMLGFTTDRNASRPFGPDPETRLTFRRLDRYHVSGGLGLYGDLGQLLLGARVTWGTGQIRVTDPLATPPAAGLSDIDELAMLFSIAGRVDMRAVARVLAGDE